jgi:hypothetical protein
VWEATVNKIPTVVVRHKPTGTTHYADDLRDSWNDIIHLHCGKLIWINEVRWQVMPADTPVTCKLCLKMKLVAEYWRKP